MSIFIFDGSCGVAVAAGLVTAFGNPFRKMQLSAAERRPDNEVGVYVRRIAGVMLAAFGLALGIISTVFYIG